MTENIVHDNDIKCFSDHMCIDCEHEKVRYYKEPCSSCIKTPKNEQTCKWKPKSEPEIKKE